MREHGKISMWAICTIILVLGGTIPVESTAAATKIARFQAGDAIGYGVLEGDRLIQISGNIFRDWKKTEKSYGLDEVKILAPTEARKVFAMAGNYRDHLGDVPVPEKPEVFLKLPTTLIGTGENIVIPKGTQDVHHECELVIVIGKEAKGVCTDEAMDYVLGITCGCDVSARDWQKGDRLWWRAKGSDTFGPCGPFISSGIDYANLDIQTRVNGEVRQKSNTEMMIFGIAEIVSFISQSITLEPGDLIFTGTPGKTTKINPGDVVEIEIEDVGILKNPVVGSE